MPRISRLTSHCLPWLGLVVLIVLFVGYIPTQARGPLDQDRVMGGIRLYYAPRYNLSEIDQALLASARKRIDLAGYVLTDRGIMEALMYAAKRGVKVRLYLDPDQPAAKSGSSFAHFFALLSTKGIETRIKTDGRDFMHLKSYHIDGKVLRTGAANFSYSGLRRQDNDLLVIESEQLAGQFIARFNLLWRRPGSANADAVFGNN